jgi:hypothetical protein
VDERRMDIDIFSMRSKEDDRNQKKIVEIIHPIDGGRGKEDMIEMIKRGGTTGERERERDTSKRRFDDRDRDHDGVQDGDRDQDRERGPRILIVIGIEIGGDSTYFVAYRRLLIYPHTGSKVAVLF